MRVKKSGVKAGISCTPYLCNGGLIPSAGDSGGPLN